MRCWSEFSYSHLRKDLAALRPALRLGQTSRADESSDRELIPTSPVCAECQEQIGADCQAIKRGNQATAAPRSAQPPYIANLF